MFTAYILSCTRARHLVSTPSPRLSSPSRLSLFHHSQPLFYLSSSPRVLYFPHPHRRSAMDPAQYAAFMNSLLNGTYVPPIPVVCMLASSYISIVQPARSLTFLTNSPLPPPCTSTWTRQAPAWIRAETASSRPRRQSCSKIRVFIQVCLRGTVCAITTSTIQHSALVQQAMPEDAPPRRTWTAADYHTVLEAHRAGQDLRDIAQFLQMPMYTANAIVNRARRDRKSGV